MKENKPEEIRRYQNLLDEHHHNIYKARFDAIPAGVVQSYKAKLAKEQISDEKYIRKHIVKRYCSKHGWTGTSWFNRNKYKKAMKIVQQEDEKILLKQNILLKEYQSRAAMTTLRKENWSQSEPIQKAKLGRRWRSRSPPQRRWRSRSPPQRRFQISNNSNNNAVTLSTKNHVASILVQRIGNTSH